MSADWTTLSPDIQASLQREAMRQALDELAGRAEALAREMESGGLADRGGPDALRLLVALVRAGTIGHA
jgi:hypothetical protein